MTTELMTTHDARLEEIAVEIENVEHDAVVAAKYVGRLLVEAKEYFQEEAVSEFDANVAFGRWRGARLAGCLSKRSSQEYMNLHRNLGDADVTERFGLNVLCELAAPKLDPIRNKVVRRIMRRTTELVDGDLRDAIQAEWEKCDPALLPTKALAKKLTVADAQDQIERLAQRLFNAFIDDDLAEVVAFWEEMPEVYHAK